MTLSPRREQLRSAATRRKLVEATLDQIFEVGYHAATTQEIAARAHVSRGALLHHFPMRADLILAAMGVLLDDGTRQIEIAAGDIRDDRQGLDDFVKFLWGLFSDRFFYLSLEMIAESRNDTALRERMIPVVSNASTTRWIPSGASSAILNLRVPHEARIVLNLTVCLVRGMGVQTVLRPEPGYYRKMVDAWKALLPHLVSGEAGRMMFGGAHIGTEREPFDATR